MTKPIIRKSIGVFLLLLFYYAGRAQNVAVYPDSIAKHMEWYAAKKSTPVLFAHLDKTVYVNNETIWFTAYLIASHTDLPRHLILAVSLVDNNNQKMGPDVKFPIVNGVAYGNLAVPDTIPPGNYNLVALTNVKVNGQQHTRFIQPITVKSPLSTAFNVELVLDTLYKDPLNSRVLVNARSSTDKALPNATVNYTLGKDKKTRLTGEVKTNVLGSSNILIPKSQISDTQHNLEVQVKSGQAIKTLHIDIPLKKQKLDVKFYPEGGYLVANMINHVGWEVKTPGGTAVKTSAIIYADGKPVDTIETDSYGMGHFQIRPRQHINYTAKLESYKSEDAIYNLPSALAGGLTLNLTDAIVNDTLKAKLQSSYTGKFKMLVHNYKQLFSATDFKLSGNGLSVKVDLAGIPRGINVITMTDSLNRPVAERLFFAHYSQKPSVAISMDVSEPDTRQKVNVKIKLNGNGFADAKGLVSVACVQDSRFEIKKGNNIENYTYLQNELDNLPMKDNLMGNTELDRQYLNELLLVRGWSKYTWPDMIKTAAADTVKTYEDLLFGGVITYLGKELKKPVQLVLLKDTMTLSVLNSTSAGRFTLTSEDVYSEKNKGIRLIVSGKSESYYINVNDPYETAENDAAKAIDPLLFDPPVVQNTKEFVFDSFKKVTNLREVKIKAQNLSVVYGSNACGDYVCRFGILNCTNHLYEADNRQPRKGERLRMPFFSGLVWYSGCEKPVALKPGMVAFTGVYNSKEFYGADYAEINPTDQDLLSTIYWKHSLALNADKEAEFSFYTSDITGKFRIVVQGVTNKDVLYGETTFDVRKKKLP